ncbi:MAG: hypothetical protein LIP01_14850 [Tannerellaceae bacterium]|nr:hypothetical protein [Tannerellaceae bacterium]
MKLRSIFSILMVSCVLFTACNQEDDFAGIPTQDEEQATGYATVYLQDTPKGYSTRSTDDDSKIEVVEFYVFKEDGTRDTKTGGTNGESNGTGYVKFTDTTKDFVFAITANNNLTILAAVNQNLGELSEYNTITKIKEALNKKAIENPTDLTISVPMTGQVSNVKVEEEAVGRVGISVSRLYSRLNEPTATGTVSIPNEELERLNAEAAGNNYVAFKKFELTGHFVINGLNQSYVSPNYGVANEWMKWDADVWTIGTQEANYTASVYKQDGNLKKSIQWQ